MKTNSETKTQHFNLPKETWNADIRCKNIFFNNAEDLQI